MAIVRCPEHSPPKERTRHYVESVKPLGYPITGVICGRHGCKNPGLIWLEASELKRYQNGETVFGMKTNTVRVKAEELE
jgi:hypothetical protein